MSLEDDDAPLAGAGSQEVLIIPETPRGGSNQRAVKVACLTTLACLLLASQVFTVYMVVNQKQQIHSLQKNTEKMSKIMSRIPPAGTAQKKMNMPLPSMPLFDFLADDLAKAKTTLTRPKNPVVSVETQLNNQLQKPKDPVVSVETQLRNYLQDFELPRFNETFLTNLQSLKEHMNGSEWESFETWMRFWLTFQMAQQKQAPLRKTKCQLASAPGDSKIGTYTPQCDDQGRYVPLQCWHATGFCWCVDESGTTIEGTTMRGNPGC